MLNFDKEFIILLGISINVCKKRSGILQSDKRRKRDFVIANNLCIFKMYIFSLYYIFCTLEIIAINLI